MPKKKITRKAKKTASKKTVAKKVSQNRAAGKTQISMSLPQDLVERIDRLAIAENRNRSNYIATVLEELCSSTSL